jgi:hypothetical protein
MKVFSLLNNSLVACCVLLFVSNKVIAQTPRPNTLGFIPASIEEIDVAFGFYLQTFLIMQNSC